MIGKIWSREEEIFLFENYPKFGADFCSKNLKRSIGSIRKRAKILKLKFGRVKYIYQKDILSKVVKESKSISEVLEKIGLRKAGGNFAIINKYLSQYKIDTTHFITGGFKSGQIPINKIPLDEILVENSSYSRNNLKKRLYDSNILEKKCCLCGQDENWNGMKISLILDHINGVHNDNRLENLRIVCPNCNAGLDTFAGRNSKNKRQDNFCQCGEKILKNSSICVKCLGKKKRKVERPTIDQLIKDVEDLGYLATGRKYGVSDNSIRKWLKS
jgi:hypothetical protein